MIQAIYDQLSLKQANTEKTTKTRTHVLVTNLKERLSANFVEWSQIHTNTWDIGEVIDHG